MMCRLRGIFVGDTRQSTKRLLCLALVNSRTHFRHAISQIHHDAANDERGRGVRGSVAVRNTGGDRCLVTGARLLDGTDPAFSLPDPDLRSVSIAPGGIATVRVAYTPQAVGLHAGRSPRAG